MFHITRVEIDGFWGKHKIVTNFDPSVNIFIGRNGTGKTTFMNLLQAVLRIDLPMLSSLEFSTIVLKLRDRQRTRTISVEKYQPTDASFEFANFKIGQRSYRLPLYPRDMEVMRRHYIRTRSSEEYNELKKQVDDLVNLSSLSVHRTTFENVYEDEYVKRNKAAQSPIDQRLEELIRQLTSYQLTLAERSNKISSDFQKAVLVSMLYDQRFDRFTLEEALEAELSKEKDDLSRAYKELGVLDKNVSKKIDEHISVLSRSITNLRQRATERISVNDIMPLPLLRRTQHIINLSLRAENQKQEIFQLIRLFTSIIKDFLIDKDISFATSGEILINKEGKNINISDLSSGEKQLLILLTETLLQKNEFFIFLADEPELSLHIEWQAKIISTIKKINSKSQIIVATHSPEIAGGWKENIIDMEDILHA